MSVRKDMLALSPDDLVSFSNRGNLNRAQRDLDSGQFNVEYKIDQDEVIVVWSDPATCVFPAGKTVSDAFCTCPATSICRHIVRSVLAYQRDMAHAQTPQATGPWNPGDMGDDVLSTAFSAALIAKAKALVEDSMVVELVRSEKPSARFHHPAHTVKFLVRNDIRYAHCNCASASPCVHAGAAVLAFRRLPADEIAGIVTTADESPKQDKSADDALELLSRLATQGIARSPAEAVDRLRGLGLKLADHGWVWPADVVQEIAQAHALYHSHDARFSGDEVAELFGEFAIRIDALGAPAIPVPRSFVQGSAADEATKLGQSRFIGLGCLSRVQRGHVDMLALMQDAAHGRVIAVTHRFTEPPDTDELPSLAELGSRLVFRGRSLASFGSGQIVMQQAKLTQNHRLDLGKAQASVYAQNFRWEELLAPVLVDGFDELQARLASLAPASLRSRRVGEDVHVCPIDRVEDVIFVERTQSVIAKLVATDGSRGILEFGYSSRNRDGCERLLTWLNNSPQGLKFVAGIAKAGPNGVVLAPTGLVFEIKDESGTRRELIQPWVDSLDAHLETSTATFQPSERVNAPLGWFISQSGSVLGDILVQGLDDFVGWSDVEELGRVGNELGFQGISRAFDELHSHKNTVALFEALALNSLLQEA